MRRRGRGRRRRLSGAVHEKGGWSDHVRRRGRGRRRRLSGAVHEKGGITRRREKTGAGESLERSDHEIA